MYDGFNASGKLKDYYLPSGRRLRYLRITDKNIEKKRAFKVRNDPEHNAIKFKELIEHIKFMDMEEHCEAIWKILAAILMLGEIRFVEGNNGEAELDNNEAADRGEKFLKMHFLRQKIYFDILNHIKILVLDAKPDWLF